MTPLLAQRQRSDRAFERLYRRHVGDVYRYALAVMRKEADAEDVAQTAFMNAYRAFRRGEQPDKPLNWLIAITHNVCRQRFRHAARRPTEVAFEEGVAEAVAPDDAPSAEDIRRALGLLAFNQRAALVMRELEGRSYGEIGEILELSPSAVETLIFRARRALREQLESSLTCGEAEFAVSRQLDGRLSREERAGLRAHLRECAACATFARRQRAQRSALRSLAAIPVPSSLLSLFGGGAAGTGIAVKAAVVVTAGVALGGAGYIGVHDVVSPDLPAASARPTHGARPRTEKPLTQTPRRRQAAVAIPRHARSRHHGLAHPRAHRHRGHAAKLPGPGVRRRPRREMPLLDSGRRKERYGDREQAQRSHGMGGLEGREAGRKAKGARGGAGHR
jgi:RNA polymerase sigma factor (sigma-70 family)